MTYKEKIEVARVIVAVMLFFAAIFGMVNHADGWVWFLLIGALIYPTHINIDFRESV